MAKVLQRLVISGIFLLTFLPLPVFSPLYFPYITSKAFIFRILVEIVFALWVWLVLSNKRYRPQWTPVTASVAVWLGVIVLATVFGANPYRSFWSNYERMEGLINFLHFGAYFVVIVSMLNTKRIWRWFWQASLGVSVISVFIAFGEFLRATPGVRLDAMFGNPIYFAVCLLLHLFLALFLLTQTKNKLVRWVYCAVILAELWALYYSGTRSAQLGLLVGGVTTLACIAIGGWRQRRGRVAAATLALVVLAGGGFWLARGSVFVQSSPVLSRFADISLSSGTSHDRLLNWQMALRGFVERPVLGWGPENYNLVFSKYFDPALYSAEPWFDRTHNIFLDWLISAGVLGLVSYLALFVCAFYYIWWKIKSSDWDLASKSIFTGLLVGYLFHNIFVFDNLISYVLFLSLLAYLHSRVEPELAVVSTRSLGTVSTSSWQWAIVPAVGVLLVVTTYYVNIKPMLASAHIIRAITVTTGEAKLAEFKKVFGYKTFGSNEAVEQLVGNLPTLLRSPQVSPETKEQLTTLAVTEMEKVIARSPDDARYHLFYGQFLQNIGRHEEAVASLELAHALSPQKQQIMFPLAGGYLSLGKSTEALALAKQAYDLAPAYPEARAIYALIAIRLDKTKLVDELYPGGVPAEDRFINAYVALKDYKQVLALWQKRVASGTASTQEHFSLAAAYLILGQRAQSIAEIEKAIQLDPAAARDGGYLISQIKAGKNPLRQAP